MMNVHPDSLCHLHPRRPRDLGVYLPLRLNFLARRLNLPLALVLLAGCSMTPDYERPAVEMPQFWRGAAVQTDATDGGAGRDPEGLENAQITQNAQDNPAASAYAWWREFNSAELDTLMDEALENNTDLRAGIQRMEQARAALKIAGASAYPSVGASGSASRRVTNPETGRAIYASGLGVNADISYELDLFGANKARADAAEAGYRGSLYDQEALSLSLMGDVASTYFTLVNLRERIAVADSNLDNAREVLRIMNARFREGAESELELSQQRSAVASREAARASLEEQLINAENALSVLLGRPPQNIDVERVVLDGLVVPDITPEQPSRLLERRPDLRSAEAALLAANANIGVVRAAFFPTVSLGLGGALSWAGLGDPSTSAFSLASSLGAPIFQGGRLEGGVEQANARQLELVENYRGRVFTAFREVEDALAAVRAAQLREEALHTAMREARNAYNLSRSRYDAGAIDFQTLLDTQTAQLSAEDTFAQARLARLNAAVQLYRALGGGWR